MFRNWEGKYTYSNRKRVKENPELTVGVFLSVHTKREAHQILESVRTYCRFWWMLSAWKLRDGRKCVVEPAVRIGLRLSFLRPWVAFVEPRKSKISRRSFRKSERIMLFRVGGIHPNWWQSTGGLSSLPDADGLPTYGSRQRELICMTSTIWSLCVESKFS